MQEEIMRWLYNYAKKNMIFDEVAIEELAYEIIYEKELESYVRKIEIDDISCLFTSERDIATYSPISKSLIIDSGRCLELVKQLEMYEFIFTDFERKLFINMTILQVILHEIEHAMQDKKIHEENTMEAKILKLSNLEDAGEHFFELAVNDELEQVKEPLKLLTQLFMPLQEVRTIYDENYVYCPHERMAEIRAYKEVIDILEPFKKEYPNLVEYEEASQLESFLKGYEIRGRMTTSPTIYYLRKLRYKEELKAFDWYDEDYSTCLKKSLDKYSLLDRMTLGLPITEEEKTEKIKAFVKTNKYMAHM